ncbi:MAG TPA: MarR family transcriptional regulator [Mycobacteriales bacterium]|nr:MarR family transcriptional regulator [Mycobacteriales bacterium]
MAASPAGSGRDEVSVARFVERFASTLVDVGLPRMPARIFAALLATDSGRLTAGELARTLRISPAAVSGAIRYLTHVDMVRREREPGSRRDHYQVDDDVLLEVIRHRDQLLLRWEADLREGVEAAGPDTPAGRRMAEMTDVLEFLQQEMAGLLERWQARRAARSGGRDA